MGGRHKSKKKNSRQSTDSRKRDDDHGAGRSSDVELRPRDESSEESLLDVSTDSDNGRRRKFSQESSNVAFNEKLPSLSSSVSGPRGSTLNVNAKEFVPPGSPSFQQHSHSNSDKYRGSTFYNNSSYFGNRNRQQSGKHVGRGENWNNRSRGRRGTLRYNERERYHEKPENKDLVGDERIQYKQDDSLQKSVLSDKKNQEKSFQTKYLDDNVGQQLLQMKELGQIPGSWDEETLDTSTTFVKKFEEYGDDGEKKLLEMKELGQMPGSWDEETPDISAACVKNYKKTHDSIEKHGDNLEDQSQNSIILERSNTSLQNVLSNSSDSTSLDKQNIFDKQYSNLEKGIRSMTSPFFGVRQKQILSSGKHGEDRGDDLEDQSQNSSVLEKSNTSIQSVVSNSSDSTSKFFDTQNDFDMEYSNRGRRYPSMHSSYSSYQKPTLKELFDTRTLDYKDKEIELFKKFCRRKDIEYEKVVERNMDLFEMPEEYSLAHCVGADMRMGSGIAVTFRTTFKCQAELLNQRRTQGELAFLQVPTNAGSYRFIYYMVTKKESTGKPTYRTFWNSLKKMRDHIRENEVKKLAIPRLGCGLDRLDWNTVKQMIEYLFEMIDIEIVVCNFQQNEETSVQSPPRQGYGCKIVEEIKSIFEAPIQSIIIYFTTESRERTPIMKQFIEKYPCLESNFKRRTSMGEINFFENKTSKNSLCGCTVRKSLKDAFCFISFKKCLTEINKTKKKMFKRVFFQVTNDHQDELLDKKIMTLMKYILMQAEIHVCSDKTEIS